MAQFRMTGETLLDFRTCESPATEQSRFRFYSKLARTIGPVLIPFLIKRECLDQIPYRILGMEAIDPLQLTQQQGEMWVLFCFKGELHEDQKHSPLRSDGFVLILEWRKDTADSELLSPAFHELADLVRQQQGVSGWGLHPAFARYGDNIDFTDQELFADSEKARQVASAYGALMAGLYCAVRHKYPHWPFPTLQWDPVRGRIAGVGGLREKLLVARDFAAGVITVAKEQEGAAISLVRELADSRYRTKIYGVRQTMNFERLAEDIAFGAEKRQRFVRRLLWLALLPLVLVLTALGAVYWDATRDVVKYYRGRELLFGADVGYDPIARSEVDSRGAYEFVYRGWRRSADGWKRRLQQVSWIDKDGCMGIFPLDVTKLESIDIRRFAERCISRHVYSYNEDGTPSEMREMSHDAVRGVVKYIKGRKKYVEYVEFDRGGHRVAPLNAPVYIGYDDQGHKQHKICYTSSGQYYVATLDDCGRVIRKDYHDVDGSLVPDENAVTIYRYDYLTNGLVKGEFFLDKSGRPVKSRETGLCGCTNVYDHVGNLTRKVFLGPRFLPTAGRDGVCMIDREYDADRRVVSVWTRDERGELVVPRGQDSDTACGFFIERGDAVIERYVDKHGCAANRGGVSYVKTLFEAERESIRYFGLNGCLVVSCDGYAGIDKELNAYRQVLKLTYIGIDGKPSTNACGCSTQLNKYDEQRHVVFQEWLNSNGMPVPLRLYGCEKFGEYQSVSTRYVKETGASVREFRALSQMRINPNLRMEMNPNGTVSMIQHYDDTGNVVSGREGWAQQKFRYNEDGLCVEWQFLNEDGTLCANALSGVAYLTCWCQKSVDGDRIGVNVYGEDHYPVNDPSGMSSMSLSYDLLSRLTHIEIHDKDKNWTILPPIDICYDEVGRVHQLKTISEKGFGNLEGQKIVSVRMNYNTDGDTLHGLCALDKQGHEIGSIEITDENRCFIDAILEWVRAIRHVYRHKLNYFSIDDAEVQELTRASSRLRELQQ